MKKERVFITGPSGSMGFVAFKDIWNRLDKNGERKYDIVLLLLKTAENREMFAPYIDSVGIHFWKNKDVIEKNGLKIIWGDGRIYKNIKLAAEGVDWVLNTMAIISPEADFYPDVAREVNILGLEHIIRAIKEEPDGINRIRFINVGSIATYGERMGEVHCGRVGDPIQASPFDLYAVTKIRAEHLLLESGLKYWAQLRQTFILIPNVFSLQDPIMFHQPINSFMEAITVGDAGRGLANCLDIPLESDFWRRIYNMGGGSACRTNYYDFLKMMFGLMGLRLEKVFDRNWFALRNFHMMYYEDSDVLNGYLNHWTEGLDDYMNMVWADMPARLKIVAKLNKKISLMRWVSEKVSRRKMKKMALNKSGNLNWYQDRNELRIAAFYGSFEAFENIKGWDAPLPDGLNGTPEPKYKRLNHGYNEAKDVLNIEDLKEIASFRGGEILEIEWNGDMYKPLKWKCAFGHDFEASVYTIAKAGHWCRECDPPDWNYDEIAKKNTFFAQVWYESHKFDEEVYYPERCYEDIY